MQLTDCRDGSPATSISQRTLKNTLQYPNYTISARRFGAVLNSVPIMDIKRAQGRARYVSLVDVLQGFSVAASDDN